MSKEQKEDARTALEDAVYRALEAGMSQQEIEEEVRYALETAVE